VKKPVIVIFSIIVGYVLGSLVAVALEIVGINIPAMLARRYSEYNTYLGGEVLVLTIFFGWAMYQVLARRFLERKVDNRPLLDRLPLWARHPSGRNLVIAWVVAPFTVILYPLAIYMSWRFYVERREADSKVCPRCAERVKAAAMVCRHCGQAFDVNVTQPPTLTPA
jgi:ribosomal protein L40E